MNSNMLLSSDWLLHVTFDKLTLKEGFDSKKF